MAEKQKKEKVAFNTRLDFAATEAYKLLRVNLKYAVASEKKCKVIGVTSSMRAEGKSTTSIHLARTLAQENQRVLLIEGDMRLPSIGKKLNIAAKNGLSDYLVGLVPLQECVLFLKAMNMSILLSGAIPPNPAELLGSPRMKQCLDVLMNYYDYIIIDLPPLDAVSDGLVVTSHLDGVVLVVRQNYCLLPALDEAVEQLRFVNAKILGFVINGSKDAVMKKNKYYHKYGYGYGYGYGNVKPTAKTLNLGDQKENA